MGSIKFCQKSDSYGLNTNDTPNKNISKSINKNTYNTNLNKLIFWHLSSYKVVRLIINTHSRLKFVNK